MRIIFLGTPEFAVASLKALIEHKFEIVAVVTAPDKPAGRGMKLQQSAVKNYALEQNLPVLQPEKLKNEDFIKELKSYNADVQVVVAFRMLPEIVWNMPPKGTINVHASLLPNYRGAAPINWAIMNGEQYTGVTTFKLQQAIDTGNILLQSKIEIEENDNAGTLHDKLMYEGAHLLVKTMKEIEANNALEIPQEINEQAPHAPKIFTETCRIDWSKNCIQINNLIRGLSPYPASFTELNQKKIKIFSALAIHESHNNKAGSIICDNKTYLKFACADGYIQISELQLEGKKKMDIADFLRGNTIHSQYD